MVEPTKALEKKITEIKRHRIAINIIVAIALLFAYASEPVWLKVVVVLVAIAMIVFGWRKPEIMGFKSRLLAVSIYVALICLITFSMIHTPTESSKFQIERAGIKQIDDLFDKGQYEEFLPRASSYVPYRNLPYFAEKYRVAKITLQQRRCADGKAQMLDALNTGTPEQALTLIGDCGTIDKDIAAIATTAKEKIVTMHLEECERYADELQGLTEKKQPAAIDAKATTSDCGKVNTRVKSIQCDRLADELQLLSDRGDFSAVDEKAMAADCDQVNSRVKSIHSAAGWKLAARRLIAAKVTPICDRLEKDIEKRDQALFERKYQDLQSAKEAIVRHLSEFKGTNVSGEDLAALCPAVGRL